MPLTTIYERGEPGVPWSYFSVYACLPRDGLPTLDKHKPFPENPQSMRQGDVRSPAGRLWLVWVRCRQPRSVTRPSGFAAARERGNWRVSSNRCPCNDCTAGNIYWRSGIGQSWFYERRCLHQCGSQGAARLAFRNPLAGAGGSRRDQSVPTFRPGNVVGVSAAGDLDVTL